MKKDKDYSDEQLNAFIDGELDSEERSQLLDESVNSTEIDRRLCVQRKLKELVSVAYDEVPSPKRVKRVAQTRWSSFARSIAASALIFVGLGLGLYSHQQYDQSNQIEISSVTSSPNSENHILHVVSGDRQHMLDVLERANQLLAESSGKVEIIANEKGLNLLRSDITPFAKEIEMLAENKVVFYACARAISRLEKEGVEIQLVPAANSHFTALDRLVLRLQDGWNYTKI